MKRGTSEGRRRAKGLRGLARHTPAILRTLIDCEPDDVLPFVLGFLSGQLPTMSPIDYAAAIPGYRVGPADRWTMYEALYELAPGCGRYLEVGTRRGWSLTVALAANPRLACTSVDLFESYADAPNPGPAFVRREIERVAPGAAVEFRVGNSHTILPACDRRFDLVLVDGDHTPEGARQDVRDGWALLDAGGWLVFDDYNYMLTRGADLREDLTVLSASVIQASHHGNGTLLARKRK